MPTKPRQGTHYSPTAPMPAIVVGYRAPNPLTQLADYAAYYLLVQVLSSGDSSRLYQRMVKTGLVLQTLSAIGPVDVWLTMRDPVLTSVIAVYPPGGTVEGILAAIDETVEQLQTDLTEGELERTRIAVSSSYLRATDSVMNRALTIAPLEQQRGRAELLNELPQALSEVTIADVKAAAAKWFQPNSRSILDWQPGVKP